jgi:uncharacterized membrane protein
MLMQYERVYPGAAKLFVDWVNEETAHRRAMEIRDQANRHELEMHEARNSSRGLNYALIVCLAGFAAATWLGLTGHDIVAGIFGAVDLASLAGIFIYRASKIQQQQK